MVPEPTLVERFATDLSALAAAGSALGIALSGGPDSLALLLLASQARAGRIEAATVDHALRDHSRAEALEAAAICKKLGVRHTILTIDWPEKPTTAIQERARAERYRLLAGWAAEHSLDAIVTGHHADDQAETLLMRLNRGAGVHGLAGMRPRSMVPGSEVLLLRPLLGWRRSELEQVCATAGIQPIADPSNSDERFERVRIRKALAENRWLDPSALAASASHLTAADEALDWAVGPHWPLTKEEGEIAFSPGDAPPEIVRRLVASAIAALAHEGAGLPLRSRELDPLIATMSGGGQATLRGVICAGGLRWRFTSAPQRRQ
jgi:tRNA(Ile)-lysidine synthase